jgi:signal transduction histidine kinase
MDSTPRPQILIVDDRPENLFALQKILKSLEVDVFQASSGNDALGLALEHDFFAAILDVQMPGMDGYELAELLRGNPATAALPILFVSAVFSDEYHHRKAYDVGAVDFLSKPFVPEILLSKVKVFMALYQQRRALEKFIADLNRANAQLELTNRELETFSYSVSHDLRAPLRAIDGFSRMLADTLGDNLDPDARHYLETVRANARQMNELIESLLKFSQLAFQPMSSRRIEMKALMQDALTDLLATQPGRRVEVSLADLPDAWGDPALIKLVLANLLDNALKYTRSRDLAHLEIGSYQRGSQFAYFIRDNGAGFDMRYAGKLFGLFQRLHSSTEFEGAGVGLASARRIILRHGGEIWAESQVNQGATFSFTLPQP